MADRNLSDLKVLIVDDEEDLSEVLKALLEGMGCGNILTAADGEEGFFTAQQHLPDLIFLDLMMPGVDGVKTLDFLDSDDRTMGIPVIIQSSLLTPESVIEKEGLLHGRPCISKPYQMPQIEEAIERALQ
ncbi:response regulator [Candidatus Zixiibacteriota bacterium]